MQQNQARQRGFSFPSQGRHQVRPPLRLRQGPLQGHPTQVPIVIYVKNLRWTKKSVLLHFLTLKSSSLNLMHGVNLLYVAGIAAIRPRTVSQLVCTHRTTTLWPPPSKTQTTSAFAPSTKIAHRRECKISVPASIVSSNRNF